MTFEEVMVLTRTVSSSTAFDDDECRLMFDCAMELSPGSVILEIGCEFGRSTSILAQVAKERGHELHCVDPFVDPGSAASFVAMMRQVGVPFHLHVMKSIQFKMPYEVSIDLLHIDGDHQAESIGTDCRFILDTDERATVLFHDYGRNSLPDVYPTVNRIMEPDWKKVAVAGTLVAWRRK